MKYRKFISIALSVALIVLMVPSISLAENNVQFENKNIELDADKVVNELGNEEFIEDAKEKLDISNKSILIEKVDDDLEVMKTCMLPVDSIVDVKVGNNNIVYGIETSDKTISTVMVETEENGDIKFDIKEGNLEDKLEFTADGKIFLDGHEVTYDNSVENESSQSLAVASGWSSSFSNKPYQNTKSSDYKTKIKILSNANINAHKLLKSLTDIGLAALIGKALSYVMTGGLAGVLASVTLLLAREMKNAAEIYAPDSAYFSYKCPVYRCDEKSNGYQKLLEYCGHYYIKKNYKGHRVDTKFYEYRYFN